MKWLVALLLVVAAAYAVYKQNFPTYSYRYRLEVSVSVGEKTYTGSSVIEVAWSCGPHITSLGQCAPILGGQATVVDLGSRGVVVATLHTGTYVPPVSDKAADATWLCAEAFGNQSTNEELPKLPFLEGRRKLSPDNYPRLVWFPNPTDSQSARIVTTANIAETIDPAARITQVFVEITRDPIVVDIATKLPWYPALLAAQRGKGISSHPGQFQLVYNMFVGENSL